MFSEAPDSTVSGRTWEIQFAFVRYLVYGDTEMEEAVPGETPIHTAIKPAPGWPDGLRGRWISSSLARWTGTISLVSTSVLGACVCASGLESQQESEVVG